jgi:hypothetical protein
LIDTAGFGYIGDYVRVFAISYGLQAIFDRFEKVKFILVV